MLQLAGFSPCKDQTPQAEACATRRSEGKARIDRSADCVPKCDSERRYERGRTSDGQTTASAVHTDTRSRPSRFAQYRAWSEALRTSPIVIPWSGNRATPIEMLTAPRS